MDRHAAYRWASPGDLNAFFGLSIDNLAVLVLTVSLLATVFGYPAQFALGHLVPGTAVGVVVGELYGASAGIGFMINAAGSAFQTDRVFVGIFVIAAVGLLLTAAIHLLERP